jgi:large subunit ribosomal protein L30
MANRCLLVIRIRGGVNATVEVKDTLRMLRMPNNNTATILDDRPEYLGMLQKAKDYITWGEPSGETIRLLLEKRGETSTGGRVDAETAKTLDYDSLDDLAIAIAECRVEFNKIGGLKPFLRLHPPRKGFKKTVKRPFGSGGELGNRKEAINELAKRMC